MKRSTVRPALGAAAALALLLTGCGEAASGGAAAAGGGSDSSAGAIDASIGSQFSGGKAGAASSSASPITVGLINQEGGQVSDPEASAAAQAAVDYINKEQGGIGGHPLKLDVCKVTSSEESAQQCAQQFLNDSSVSVVMQGGLNVGADAVHSTLNGAKPDVVALANPGSDTTAANTYAVNPSVVAALPGVGKYALSKGYKALSIVTASDPGSLAIGQAAQGVFGSMGLTSKTTTYPAGSTDLTSTYTAALGSKPDALAPTVVTTSDCIASAKALESIGSSTPVLGSALCATPAVKAGTGDFPQWAYESTVLSLYAPDSTGQVAFYKSVMAKYAGADAQLGIDAPYTFGATFLLAKVLNGIGADKVTPASVAAGMKAYTDGVLLSTPKVAFGSVPNMPTLSGIADRFYVYAGDGKWTATEWQSVPQ
jgi:branched-chain amino acid transport system substrate-binding protein